MRTESKKINQCFKLYQKFLMNQLLVLDCEAVKSWINCFNSGINNIKENRFSLKNLTISISFYYLHHKKRLTFCTLRACKEGPGSQLCREFDTNLYKSVKYTVTRDLWPVKKLREPMRDWTKSCSSGCEMQTTW